MTTAPERPTSYVPADPGLPFDRLALESLLEDWRGELRARRAPRALAPELSPCRAGTGLHRHRCSSAHADLVLGYRDARHAEVLAMEEDCGQTPASRTEEARDYRAAHPLITFTRWLRSMRRR